MSGVNFGKGTSVFFILSLLRSWTVWWERGRSCFVLLLSLKSRDHGNVSENGPVNIASSSGEEPVWAGCSCTLTRQKLESKVHFLLQQEESIFPLKMFLVVQDAWETRKLIKLWFTSTYRNKTEGLWNVLKIDISTVYFETYFNKTPPDILVWMIIIMWGMFQLNYSFQPSILQVITDLVSWSSSSPMVTSIDFVFCSLHQSGFKLWKKKRTATVFGDWTPTLHPISL